MLKIAIINIFNRNGWDKTMCNKEVNQPLFNYPEKICKPFLFSGPQGI